MQERRGEDLPLHAAAASGEAEQGQDSRPPTWPLAKSIHLHAPPGLEAGLGKTRRGEAEVLAAAGMMAESPPVNGL